ncbi:hypothetical protein K439DRAFT_1613792 [Ramaria rubella]|nr:hypothetical protein K439DRAFT_1613792 [Ramaria rubella]
MPRLRGWTVNLRVGGQELPEMITQVEGTTAICGVSCLPEQNVEITVSKPDNDLAYILLVEVDNVLRVLPLEALIAKDTLLDISRGWNCSADIFRPYRWLGLEHFESDVKPPKTKYNGFVGVTRVRLYPANSTYSINTDAFFERPTKSGHLPLLKRLTHYVGMGGFEKLTHPTQPIVGTVDNFHPSTAGDLDVEFRFEYFHNILKPLASEGGRFKRKQSDSLSVETESVEDAEAGEKGLMSVPSKKPSVRHPVSVGR